MPMRVCHTVLVRVCSSCVLSLPRDVTDCCCSLTAVVPERRHQDICHKGPTTSIRWELLRQGLEDVEYLAMLDRLAGAADRRHLCGYEAAVLRGVGARPVASAAANASAAAAVCCGRLIEAKAALDSVDLVTWGITGNANASPGDPVNNVTEQQPYTTDPAVLHRVLDAVASAIEAVQQSCP